MKKLSSKKNNIETNEQENNIKNSNKTNLKNITNKKNLRIIIPCACLLICCVIFIIVFITKKNAKTSSDEYMQNIWAKILAQELSCPGSFSYKSLDILKNMTSDDFKLFERLCSLSVDNNILKDEVNDFYKKFDLYWTYLLKLKDFNLISLEDTEKTYSIEPGEYHHLIYNNRYIILLKNNSEQRIDYKLSIYIFTQFSKELLRVATTTTIDCFIVEYAKKLKAKKTF